MLSIPGQNVISGFLESLLPLDFRCDFGTVVRSSVPLTDFGHDFLSELVRLFPHLWFLFLLVVENPLIHVEEVLPAFVGLLGVDAGQELLDICIDLLQIAGGAQFLDS